MGPCSKMALFVPPIWPSKMWTTRTLYDKYPLKMTWDELGGLIGTAMEEKGRES